MPKLPSSKASRHGGNGPTAFHQDYITFAVDRTGGMTFWMPLETYGPEAGTMSFVNGSHRMGVMGDYTTYGDGDALTVFPELQDLEMSDPIYYELGDVTVHTHLTIHGAGANRWTGRGGRGCSSSNPRTSAGTARLARTSTTRR